eukprot:Gregarina_sp_Pseudo_9__5364@NODE_647_length_2426_cov_234_129870_g610_i0_p1_GENE_NODE_647_length_2426_cov_234_129870_g610_i0NODE_647_length_2426_cov_234_129870_g610_i0_p1_ORF_typecomplete_len745_score125_07Glyco_hydro_18/PF00704_28/2_8e50CBM27/PF09212_10/0_049DUF4849/PF16141_5/0_2_NODE_647_length_2426_cov_234_129870_g610_i0532236
MNLLQLLPLFFLWTTEAARAIPDGLLGDDDNPLVTIYLESWAVWDRKFFASTADMLFVNRDLPYRKLVLNHAFSVPNHADCSLRSTDTDADSQTPDSLYNYPGWGGPWDESGPEVAGVNGGLMSLKRAHPEIILLPSLGGWSRSHEFQHCIQPENREKFVDAIIQHIKWLGFDGVDFDWEYPSCEGGCGCQGEDVCSTTSNVAGHGDWEVYKSFLSYVRERFNAASDELGKYLYITMALGMNPDLLEGKGKWDVPTPFDFLCADDSPVDWMNMMSYDFFGPWAALTGPLAPLRDTPGVPDDDKMNIQYGLDYVKQHCKNMKKLTMGLATYGKGWAGVPKTGSPPGLWQQSSVNPPTGDGTYSQGGAGTLSIWEIMSLYRGKCTETFDEASETATMFCDQSPKGTANLFISYESGEAWKRKMAFARDYGMSGAIIWAASDMYHNGVDATGELFGGLFSGWTGKDYSPPNPTGASSITKIKQWPGYPCPIVKEGTSSSCSLGTPPLSFPSDESVNLAGSSGVPPTSTPVQPSTVPPQVTEPQVPPTQPAPTQPAPTQPHVPEPTTQSAALPGVEETIRQCEALLVSDTEDYTKDCRDKCTYYATVGSCYCDHSSGPALAACVSRLHGYCRVEGASPPAVTPTPPAVIPTPPAPTAPVVPPTPTVPAGSTGGSCEDKVKGVASHYDSFCKEKCAEYVPGGAREEWCPQGGTVEGQVACVLAEWPTACVLA